MAYTHDAYVYPMDQRSMFFSQPHYVPYTQPEPMYQPYYVDDFGGYLTHGYLGQDDGEDYGEVSTRPRLTKDQVEVLEKQFQDNHKPNSVTKRALAQQTHLSLARVANWFQNRRAKAKQQRKQEEYENSKKADDTSEQAETNDDEDDDLEDDQEDASESDPPLMSRTPQSAPPSQTSFPTSALPHHTPDPDKERAVWASLERTLQSARAGQQQMLNTEPVCIPEQPLRESCPPPVSQPMNLRVQRPAISPIVRWPHETTTPPDWPPTSTLAHDPLNFDFDFGNDIHLPVQESSDVVSPTSSSQYSLVSPDSWNSTTAITPTQPTHQHSDLQQPLHSPPVTMPSHPSSRRPSGADVLAANMEHFGFQTGASMMQANSATIQTADSLDNGIDLAARRKRQRPAALNSQALRSRSYGAYTAASPTFRQSMTPPAAHTLRHVKSTGHSLSAHYAGIRKASAAQKSPLTPSTFAEAEQFKKLMAQKAAEAAIQQQLTPINTQPVSIQAALESGANSQAIAMEQAQSMAAASSNYRQFQTPPITPYQSEFMLSNAAIPSSVKAQYARFTDYTPPYSAGPLTNSSCQWSDAPLTSPDVAAFSHFMPAVSLHQDDYAALSNPYYSVDPGSDMGLNHSNGQKNLEFFVQEFPNQREEHAQVAKQLAQSKPKYYSFSHATARDYGDQE